MRELLFGILMIATFSYCGNSNKDKSQVISEVSQNDRIEILYFHGKQRCITCNAIERLTKEVVEQDFASMLKEGRVVFKTIDISTEEGEGIADKYEVTWSSLFINKWDNQEEKINNMTDFGFTYAKSTPETFKEGVKTKIEELLK